MSAKDAINAIQGQQYNLSSSGINLEQIFINNNEIEKILNRYQNICSEMDQEVATLTNINPSRLLDSYSVIPELDPHLSESIELFSDSKTLPDPVDATEYQQPTHQRVKSDTNNYVTVTDKNVQP